MNEKLYGKNRKDLIKNIAIIFLAVMLALTFFSNTIMNYSLSEVATQYVQSDSITAKVRGTGSVEADDPYLISVTETRVISSVPVKVGDTVVKDQVLFYLEDKESDELKVAQDELDALLLAYTQQILSGDISQEAFQNAQGGVVLDIASYQAQIAGATVNVDNAKAALEAAEARAYTIQKQLDILNNDTVDTYTEEQAVTTATENLVAANTALATAEANLSAASGEVSGLPTLAEATSAVTLAKVEESAKKAACESAIVAFNGMFGTDGTSKVTVTSDSGSGETSQNEGDTQQSAVDNNENSELVNDENSADVDTGDGSNTTTAQEPNVLTFDITLETTNAGRTEIAIADLNDENWADIDQVVKLNLEQKVLLDNMQSTYNAYITAKNARIAAEATKSQVESSDLSSLQKAVADAKNNVDNCQNALNAANATLSALKDTSNATASKESLSNQLVEANEDIKEATSALEKVTEAQADLLVDIQAQLNLGDQNDKIAQKREEIQELKEKAIGATVVAPVDGVLTAVNKVAGESTYPDEALATMQVAGKGFSLSFSVTTEQAKNVKVGDVAEVQNSWYYDEIAAKLTAIKPDTENPSTKKLLYFEVTGEGVQSGTSLSLSIGSKNATYDYVVPNSAVREDNNGNFILIVESKSSPLGNRYIATRVDVEVLASDDTKSAISGALYGYEYVITTATKPVEAGEQVRLSEG